MPPAGEQPGRVGKGREGGGLAVAQQNGADIRPSWRWRSSLTQA
ncbi:hypothetical protein GT370_01100 [Acidocella sp. MX-AZ03]|nr:hypothetical protein [Acidocella sp. MX-AZ03]WBO59573.1 hypothetical protein GT370_01100 [Acidocella sp. MX-AZ03]